MIEFRKIPLPFLFIFSLILHTIFSIDTIHYSQTLKDGETLVSPGEIFELGFFSPTNSVSRYLGIWYKNITVRTYVWVANREIPLTTKSGLLKFTEPGILAIFNDTNGIILWSSNTSTPVSPVFSPSAKLLDSGNFILKDADDDDREENFIWQSFDYPSDTYLPGMSIGWNYETGVESYLSSWKTPDDPYPGDFTAHLDPTGYPQMFNKRGKTVLYRIGPWDGLRMSGASQITRNDGVYKLSMVINKNKVKYKEDTMQKSVLTRIVLNPNGVSSRMTWNFRTGAWIVYSNVPMDNCDTYNTCGAHGRCSVGNSPPCACLDRFVPVDTEGWGSTDWSRGCVRRTPLGCESDVFLKYDGIKLPDARNATVDEKIVMLSECESECLRKCDCVAYRQLNLSGAGSGCLFYHGDLIDIRDLPQSTQVLYIRMAASENVAHSRGRKGVILIASFTTVVGLVLVCIMLVVLCIRKRKNSNRRREGQFRGSNGKDAELPFFHLSTILKATEQFSGYNKLGEGGFGPVYRGMLEDRQEIAVKRLSETSSQGIDELKNEVILIAKLQHRNLVRLLGCCIERDENMLIYEFMPNSSLDLILFDHAKSVLLDWGKRFHIINGIAKGLLYLHQDSRLRIIHRDLKASNILLDADLNPKISDFGLARSFGGNEIAAKTRRVVGTYGYMSPEYAIDGLFSIKSDVFSFGVLVLEIVSGKRNRGFSIEDHNLNLLGHAWTLYKEDNSCKLVDASLGDSFDLSEVLRAIHVGLLCVQNCPEDRPSMSSVVFMLGNEAALPQVKPPGYFSERDVSSLQSFNSSNTANSENQITITLPAGR